MFAILPLTLPCPAIYTLPKRVAKTEWKRAMPKIEIAEKRRPCKKALNEPR